MDAYTFQLIAAAFSLIVGDRLLRLSRNTGETPEKLLGLHFLCSGFAYFGWVIPTILQLDQTESQIDFVIWFDLVPWAVYGIGMVPLLLFASVVFRPDAAWAKWMVGACTLMLFSATTMWFIQRPDFYYIENPWYWCYWLGYTIPYVWLFVEAFLSHSAARRRARIGLCDSVVVNRYLLFGCYGADQIGVCFTDFLQMMDMADNGVTGSDGISAGFDFATGGLEVGGVVILFLAFIPPKFYRNWIHGAEPAASTSGGAG